MRPSVPVTLENHIPLPPFDATPVCPKCGSDEVTAHWNAARSHQGCPLYGQNWLISQSIASVLFREPWKAGETRGGETQEQWSKAYRDRTSAVEHFDRFCGRCHFGWIEQRLGGEGAGPA